MPKNRCTTRKTRQDSAFGLSSGKSFVAVDSKVRISDDPHKQMIHSIEIDGYRGLKHFEMSNLGRVNLLVGGNNSGKTSVLEALHILMSKGDPLAIWQLLWRRGEQLPDDQRPQQVQPEFDLCHLFNNHELRVGSKISLSAKNQTPKRTIELEVSESTQKDQEKIRTQGPPIRFPFVLRVKGSHVPPDTFIPISQKGGIPQEAFNVYQNQRLQVRPSEDSERTLFITTELLNNASLVAMWEQITLTKSEDDVVKAIQILDPTVERIASQSFGPYFNASRGGFKVKQKGRELPIPIGSMGDGMWRMLAMAITLSRSKDAILLIDEIDTGLHYSVMAEMWKFIHAVAIKLNVQIFATTHNFDCVSTLAKICGNQDENARVTLNRIESGKNEAIPYTEGEIKMAAERKIETRGS